jgi:transcriptional regulator GlxA family with amidase domain
MRRKVMTRTYLMAALLVMAASLNLPCAANVQSTKPGAQSQQKSSPRNLAILIFDGVQIIDYTGPYETFGHVYNGDGPAFNIYTVSEKTNPITTAMGMSVNPKYSLENAPEPDVLLIPGGDVRVPLASGAVIRWIQDKSKGAEVVVSV